jgi:VWFA-related protein
MIATRLSTAAAVLVLVCATPVAEPARSQDPQAPQFRTGVDVIRLDVTVLDANRRPIRGLTQADFTLLEDGQPQRIVALDEIVVPETQRTMAAWTREVAPDVRTNSIPTEGRLIVLVLDDAMMPPDPAMVAATKRVATRVVEALGPDDLAAVVFTLNNRHSHDFTADRARLLRAIDTFNAGFGYTPAMPPDGSRAAVFEDDSLYQQYSIQTLRRAAESLRDIPMRKKTLVYVSVGVPIDPLAASTPAEIKALTAEEIGSFVPVHASLIHSDLTSDTRDAFGQAATANVNIYALNPAGPGGMEGYLQTRRMDMLRARHQARLHTEFLRTVAEASGGRAIVDTNEFDAAIDEIFQETSAYYLLGYQTPNPEPDGRMRRVEVKVNRPGATVLARRGYTIPRPPRPRRADQPEPSPLATAMAGFLPKGDVPMQAMAVPFALPRGRDVAVAIVARLEHPPVETRTVQTVELAATAFDADGRSKGSRRLDARVVLLPTDGRDAEYEVLSRIDLRPGRYNLRIASHNKALGASGSVYYDIDVPDFSRQGLSLSGVVVGATPGLPSAPRDVLADLLPVVPTTMREFEEDDEAVAYLRIYQRGRSLGPVAMAVRVTDTSGAIVHRAEQVVGTEAFRDGVAEFRTALPLAVLAPGQHLLTIEATAGASTVTRDIRFGRR